MGIFRDPEHSDSIRNFVFRSRNIELENGPSHGGS
jgi:hypothetical protein